ncbi:MAG: UvrD-helicase domain-containing protein [Methanobrevibacter sp.]|uniref:UvrD-helicase domain-containing protein n=1 Tax=Methanobrevibacter sp. TaxID=66852 RepID=UPI0026E0A95A|nr:UvrD-helicase domain-containing protein [Methanobrevibacter sp.]MDO5848549.1 UvrD-helicase domain-containing protein [Methanobrevibacter sp.]
MLKKICPNCENICDVDDNNCNKCGNELYYYLTSDNVFGKVSSLFSKNNEEDLILDELDQLENWETFFNDFKNNLENPGDDFFEKIKDFKKAKSDFKYLDNLRVDKETYNSLLSEYNVVSNFIDDLDDNVGKFNDYNLKESLTKLKENNVDSEDVGRVKSILDEFNNSDNSKYFEFYNDDSKALIAIANEIEALFSIIYGEFDALNNLKTELDNYNNSKEFPCDIKKFKGDCSDFEYLNLLPVFYPDLEKYVDIIASVNELFDDLEKEKSKLRSLSSDCSDFLRKFEYLHDNIKESDDFLSEYSELESKINDFKYLDLILQLDDSLENSIDEIHKVSYIFNNFDNKSNEIVAKHEDLERILSFSYDYEEFNNSWAELLSEFREERDKELFLEKYSDLKESIDSFSWHKTENEDYKKAISDAKSILFKLDNIDKFIKVNNVNIGFSEFSNISKESYIDSNYKNKLLSDYRYLFDDFNNLKMASRIIDVDIIDEPALNLASRNFDKFIKGKNDEFVESELERYYSFFSDIDGKSLDVNQRKSIVTDERNMQIIAGAGCGKTLTISGKVNYLLDKGVKPEEILCLSYSKASADDLVKKLPDDIEASTFHSLGKGILEEDLGKKVLIKDNLLDDVVNDFFSNVVFEDKELLEKVSDYFTFYSYDVVDRENKNLGEILEIEEGRSFTTLKERYSELDDKKTFKYNQRVKSFEELLIANFLFIHGIDYEYEKQYVDKDGKKVKEWNNYKPDFYLTDYGIYLEHFGVNRNLDAPWLDKKDSDKYKQAIFDKRSLHKEHGTKLIETYSYLASENILMSELRRILEENGVEVKDVDYEEVLKALATNDKLDSFKSFINLIKSFISLFKGNNFDSSKFDEFKKQAENEKIPFNKTRHLLFLDIVEEIYRRYEKEMEDPDVIDFDDMINGAIDVIRQNKVFRNYKYIIVDEYQDISYSRFKLLKEIQDASNSKIFVVGDDWQSIYRFTGCDVGLFTNFQNYFSDYERCYIENTYRNSQSLIDIAGRFINKNPNQLVKNLNSKQESDIKNPIKIAYYKDRDDKSKIKALEDCVKDISKTSKNILILARYNSSIKPYIAQDSPFKLKNSNRDNNKFRIIYKNNPSLNINFLTVHSSKGLEEDNVILLDLENSYMGFPSKKEDDSVLKYVINEGDQFEFAEERRLFYVGITRTKKYNYFLVNYDKPSQFVEELNEFADAEVLTGIEFDPKNEKLIRTKLKCPICKTGHVSILKVNKNYMKFICSHNACDWDGGSYRGKFNDLDIMENCPRCDGILYVSYGKYGPYASCSKWTGSPCEGRKSLNGKFDGLIEEYKKEKKKSSDNTTSFKGKKSKKTYKKPKEAMGKCPKCGKDLVKRKGKYGDFIGCSGYPKCRYTCQVDELENILK